eukprot:13577068-Ditylum_brightwellii.AAC.1
MPSAHSDSAIFSSPVSRMSMSSSFDDDTTDLTVFFSRLPSFPPPFLLFLFPFSSFLLLLTSLTPSKLKPNFLLAIFSSSLPS